MQLLPPLRHPLHYVFGFLSALSALVSPALPISATAIFIAYEIYQGRVINDNVYPDLLEWLLGHCLALPVLIILYFTKII